MSNQTQNSTKYQRTAYERTYSKYTKTIISKNQIKQTKSLNESKLMNTTRTHEEGCCMIEATCWREGRRRSKERKENKVKVKAKHIIINSNRGIPSLLRSRAGNLATRSGISFLLSSSTTPSSFYSAVVPPAPREKSQNKAKQNQTRPKPNETLE